MNKNRDYIEKTYPGLQLSYIECEDGWLPHINRITDRLVKEITGYNTKNGTNITFVINQIKEKFGSLRYYISFNNTTITDNDFTSGLHKYIWDMEHISNYICEKCGMYADTKKTHGWWKTICDECNDKLHPEEGEDDIEPTPIDSENSNG